MDIMWKVKKPIITKKELADLEMKTRKYISVIDEAHKKAAKSTLKFD